MTEDSFISNIKDAMTSSVDGIFEDPTIIDSIENLLKKDDEQISKILVYYKSGFDASTGIVIRSLIMFYITKNCKSMIQNLVNF